jgi:hypothetical protein
MRLHCVVLLSVVLLLQGTFPLYAGWREQANAAIGARCYLKARQRLLAERSVSEKDPVLLEGLRRLDRLIDAKLNNSAMPLADRHYCEGYKAWSHQDFLSARNHWFKYLETRKKMPEGPEDPQGKEVQEFFQLANVPSPAVNVAPQSARAFDSLSPHRKKRRTKKKKEESTTPDREKEPVPTINSAATAAQLTEQAKRVFENGHYEYAKRLYTLASRLDPASVPIQEGLHAVNKELDP